MEVSLFIKKIKSSVSKHFLDEYLLAEKLSKQQSIDEQVYKQTFILQNLIYLIK
jgi:hypothetical protein